MTTTVTVIGGGIAGLVAAATAAEHGAVVARSTSSVGKTCRRGATAPPPSIRAASVRTAAAAMAAIGWRTVVRRNDSQPAIVMSSKPTSESSPGTLTPRLRAASSAPSAITSLPQKIAVGGRSSPRSARQPS